MADSDLIPFTFWSMLTGIIIVISGLSYIAFLRRKNEKSSWKEVLRDVAESFKQDSEKSILAGIAIRRDFVIDGFVFGNSTVSRNDANEIIKI